MGQDFRTILRKKLFRNEHQGVMGTYVQFKTVLLDTAKNDQI